LGDDTAGVGEALNGDCTDLEGEGFSVGDLSDAVDLCGDEQVVQAEASGAEEAGMRSRLVVGATLNRDFDLMVSSSHRASGERLVLALQMRADALGDASARAGKA